MMINPRVIIADEDADYLVPLELKFVNDFFNAIDLEMITDRMYFRELFSTPQSAQILVISEDLYDDSLKKHNIENIFILTERNVNIRTEGDQLESIFKYSSVKNIFSEIVGKSSINAKKNTGTERAAQLVVVTSAGGGTGKTTLALGICTYLAQSYKRVLYLQADRLQNPQFMFENSGVLGSMETYRNLSVASQSVYQDIRHVIRKEDFSYLPAFKAALKSLGLEYSLFLNIALSAKKSGDYDYIVVDAESTFDEEKGRMLDLADRVIVVMEQSIKSVTETNTLTANIGGINPDKYLFVCNKFDEQKENALIMPDISLKFAVSEYVENFDNDRTLKCRELSQKAGIRKVAYQLM